MTEDTPQQILDYTLRRHETLDQQAITSLVEQEAIRADLEIDTLFDELGKSIIQLKAKNRDEAINELVRHYKV